MPIEIFQISESQAAVILRLAEGHFADLKAGAIAPAKLSRTISAFANADGGELFIGVSEKRIGDEKVREWAGFKDAEEANGHLQLFESLSPLGQDCSYEFLRVGASGTLVLHAQVRKSARIISASDGVPYIRRGAQNLPVTTIDALRQLERNKGITSFETETTNVDLAGLATNLLWLRRLDEARAAADRYLILGPTNPEAYQLRAMVALAQGDLPAARKVIHSAEGRIDRDELLGFTAYYWDLFWVLDDAQQAHLLELSPSAFYSDTLWWHIVRAQVYRLRGDSSKSGLYAEAARKAATAVTRQSREASEFSRLGLANAYAGRAEEAVQAGQTSVALLPLAKDGLIGAQMVYRLACIQSLVGKRDEALATLQTLLSVPYYVSPAWLALDPNFIPLRGDERFARLIRGES